MILGLSSIAQRGLLVVASFAVALILSYFSIRNALAAHYAGLETPEGYERATRLEPANPRNWYLLGRYWQRSEERRVGKECRFLWGRDVVMKMKKICVEYVIE